MHQMHCRVGENGCGGWRGSWPRIWTQCTPATFHHSSGLHSPLSYSRRIITSRASMGDRPHSCRTSSLISQSFAGQWPAYACLNPPYPCMQTPHVLVLLPCDCGTGPTLSGTARLGGLAHSHQRVRECDAPSNAAPVKCTRHDAAHFGPEQLRACFVLHKSI